MASPSYFHVCPILLTPGSVILPGNWGRILRQYVSPHRVPNYGTMLRERVLEDVRVRKFPGKPSRLATTFLWGKKEDAFMYRESNAPFDVIYKVEVLDPKANAHTGSFANLSLPEGATVLLAIEPMAERYWSGEPLNLPPGLGGPVVNMLETITESPIRVIEMADDRNSGIPGGVKVS